MITVDVLTPNLMKKLGCVFGALYLSPLLNSGSSELNSLVVASYGLSDSGKTTLAKGVGTSLHLKKDFFQLKTLSYASTIDIKQSGYFRYVDFCLHDTEKRRPRHELHLPGIDFLEHAPIEHIVNQPGAIVIARELNPEIQGWVKKYFKGFSKLLCGTNFLDETIDSFNETIANLSQETMPSSSMNHNATKIRRVSIIPTSDHALARASFKRFETSVREHFRLNS